MTAATMARSRISFQVGPRTLRILVLGVILIAWEVLPRLDLVPRVLVASLSSTLAVGVYDFHTFANALFVTVSEILLGLLIAYGLGGIIGVVIGSVRSFRITLLPLVGSVYAVPFVIVYPLLTVWTGIGIESKVLFGGFYGLFPMILATAAGVQMVDPALIRAARSMGARPHQIVLQVLVPAAFPSILSGLRIGGALVAIGVVVAEMLASTEGIGFLITQDRTMFNTPGVYFGILLVVIIAWTFDASIGLVERRMAAWQPRRANRK